MVTLVERHPILEDVAGVFVCYQKRQHGCSPVYKVFPGSGVDLQEISITSQLSYCNSTLVYCMCMISILKWCLFFQSGFKLMMLK